MIWRVILICFVSISVDSFSVAQNQDSWHVTVFDGREIIVIDENGIIDTIPVPDQLLEIIMPGPSYKPFLLSDDMRYLVAVTEIDYEANNGFTITIADLQTQSCCVTFDDPLGASLLDINLGIFNPENRLFTATIGTVYPDTTEDAMVVVDAETGDVLHQVDPKALMSGARMVEFLNWNGEEIELLPLIESTPFLGDFVDTNTVYWNLETGEFNVSEQHYDGFFGVSLPVTNEYLRSRETNNNPELRVVELIKNGNVADATEILSFAQGDYLPTPQWVLDGQGFLLRNSKEYGKLILRDGTVVDVPFEEITRFIAGTPDGWLAQQTQPADSRTLFHFAIVDGDVQMTPIQTFDRILFTLHRPELGANIDLVDTWSPVMLD